MSRRKVRKVLWAAVVGSLLAAPPAVARGPVFGGTTAGGSVIVLRTNAKAKKLTSAVVAWIAVCGDGQRWSGADDLTAARKQSGFPDASALTVSRNKRGRFAGMQMKTLILGDGMTAGVMVSMSGRMTARHAAGRLSATVTTLDAAGTVQDTCETGSVKWSATRDKGRIFGGSTSQEQPVVVRLDRARSMVRDLKIGWGSETCVPEGYATAAESFGNFPVRQKRFGDTFSRDAAVDDGSKQTIAYDITGTISRRAVAGSFRATLTQFDPAGAQAVSCDTGAVSWRALTG